MKTNVRIRSLLFGVSLVALAGCATYPVSKNLRQQASPASLAQVMENPGNYQGRLVIWGGRVIKTLNATNGAALYVLKLPLTRHERPQRYAATTGRFIAQSSGFLDPEVYKRGRLVTVAGTVSGVRREALQKTTYAYPVIHIKQLHLWPRVHRTYYYSYPAWGWGMYAPGWYWGYGPGWGVGWGWYYPDWDWDGDYPGDWD